MTDPEAISFFETFAAYFTALTAEAKQGWGRWLNLSDVTLDVCLKILEGLKEQKDKPRLPQFQARFLQQRNVGKYQYDRGCNKCKLRGRSTGWLQGLYGMKAKWDMKYYTGVPIEQRNWNLIWPAVLVDPKDKREEVILEYYQLHALPCSCQLGQANLEREIKAERPPYNREDHLRISTTLAMTQQEAGAVVTEFQALAVKKYGAEATKSKDFLEVFGMIGNPKKAVVSVDFFDVDGPARFHFPKKSESEFARELSGTFAEPQPQPDVPADPAPVGRQYEPEEGKWRWEDLEIEA